jgi:hypothetical protein
VERDSQPNTRNLILFIQTHPTDNLTPPPTGTEKEREREGGKSQREKEKSSEFSLHAIKRDRKRLL